MSDKPREMRWLLGIFGVAVLLLALVVIRGAFSPTSPETPRRVFDDRWINSRPINDQLAVYPAPNTTITLDEYNQGMLKPGWDTEPGDTYNLCLYVGDFTMDHAISPLVITTAPTRTPTPIPLQVTTNNFSVSVDGEQISSGHLGIENTFEVSATRLEDDDRVEIPGFFDDTYILCYRYPLSVGTHRMQYRWQSDGVFHQEEWMLTVIENNT